VVDAERDEDDVFDAGLPQRSLLGDGSHECDIKRCQKAPKGAPPTLSLDPPGRTFAEPTSERGENERAEVIRMPKGRAHTGQVSARGDGESRQVRRMRFEHVGVLGPDNAPNPVETPEQVIRGIVRKRYTRDAHHASPAPCVVRPASGRRVRCVEIDRLTPRSRGDHDMVVTEMAQNMTPVRKMASNPTSSFGIELGNIKNVQRVAPGAKGTTRRPVTDAPVGDGAARSGSVTPSFAALAARHGRPLRIAILSDFTRIPYANGAVFQTRFLYQQLRRCGHEVTVIGPRDPDARPDELAPGTVALPSIPLKTYPGLHLPMPLAPWIFDPDRWDFDICFAQTTSLLLEFGVWLRQMKGTPLLCVNTTHLVAAYDVLLPEILSKSELVQAGLHLALKRPCEKLFAGIYNRSDGLVVLSEGLRTYWRERGVRAPIHVIPRVVQPEVFDRPIGVDPYPCLIQRRGLPGGGGPRLLCAGRHTREKAQDRVIRVFARHVLVHEPEATLTLVGTGPDTAYYERIARELGVEHRVLFTGEVPWTVMPDFYRYADLFVYASLSETYGNVLGEALWCGTATVAFADGMGISSQIQDGHNGILLAPGHGERGALKANAAFGAAVVSLLRDPEARARLGNAAAKRARERCSPPSVEQRLAESFTHAQDHALASGLRPAADRPRVVQWLTTLRHARPWTAYNGMVYLSGHLRPASAAIRARSLVSFAR
jgi:1,2-diacylglycerol 3-alpha-glucosyltransferase